MIEFTIIRYCPYHVKKDSLAKLFRLCRKEKPFRHPDGQLYLNVDSVAMSSPLGPIFANFYMGYLERMTFTEIYRWSIVGMLMIGLPHMWHEAPLNKLKTKFESNSVLNFTIELNDSIARMKNQSS